MASPHPLPQERLRKSGWSRAETAEMFFLGERDRVVVVVAAFCLQGAGVEIYPGSVCSLVGNGIHHCKDGILVKVRDRGDPPRRPSLPSGGAGLQLSGTHDARGGTFIPHEASMCFR